ncbi:MAG: hypothetical protein JST39_01580 [Bacteroidetes bacterium]|nr:hypothetical protein [Bacteroidota bacterium]
MSHSKVTEIKPHTAAELARMYGVAKATFNKWLKPHQVAIGPRVGHFYTSLQVKIIFEVLGLPYDEATDA